MKVAEAGGQWWGTGTSGGASLCHLTFLTWTWISDFPNLSKFSHQGWAGKGRNDFLGSGKCWVYCEFPIKIKDSCVLFKGLQPPTSQGYWVSQIFLFTLLTDPLVRTKCVVFVVFWPKWYMDRTWPWLQPLLLYAVCAVIKQKEAHIVCSELSWRACLFASGNWGYYV